MASSFSRVAFLSSATALRSRFAFASDAMDRAHAREQTRCMGFVGVKCAPHTLHFFCMIKKAVGGRVRMERNAGCTTGFRLGCSGLLHRSGQRDDHAAPRNTNPSHRCRMNRIGGIDWAAQEQPRRCLHSKHTRLLSCGSRSLFNICSANRSENLKPSFAKTASRLMNL